MSLHDYYLQILQWAFFALNYLRICAYLPTLRKLLRAGARSEDHSAQSWGIWTASHVAFLLMLLEQSAYALNAVILVTALNAAMCGITCALILRLRAPAPAARRTPAVFIRPRTIFAGPVARPLPRIERRRYRSR